MSFNITHNTSGCIRNTGEFYTLSKYVPILTFFTELSKRFEDVFDIVSLVLQEPILGIHDGVYSNSSNKIITYLEHSGFLRQIETNGLKLYIGKGMICDEHNNILLCLTIETQFILDLISKEQYHYSRFIEKDDDFVGYDPFIMFVSTDFASDKKYATLYRRIKKIYLDFCFEKGIEMRLISSSKIKENTFTNNLKIKFNSLTELNHHLTEDVKHLLQTPLVNFKENDYPLLLGNPPISKSKIWEKETEDATNRGIGMHQQIENLILQRSGDSMLEDSDLDERAFEQEIVQLNLENFPSQTLSEMMAQISNQSVTWEEPVNSDRSMAAGLAMLSSNRQSFRDMATEMIGIPGGYFNLVDSDSVSITQEMSAQSILDRYSGISEYDGRGATTNLLYVEEPFPDASIDDVEEEQEDLPY